MYLTPVSLLCLTVSASVCSCSLNNPRQDGLSMQANIPSNTEPFNFTSVSNDAAIRALGLRCGPGNGECEHGLCCSPSGNSTDPRSHTCLTPDSG